MIHHVKVEPIDVGHYKVFVDNKLMSASKVDVHIDRESIPSVILSVNQKWKWMGLLRSVLHQRQ